MDSKSSNPLSFLTSPLFVWGGVAFLGFYLFVYEFLPARADRRETDRLVQTLYMENAALKAERDHLEAKKRALLRSDPTAIQQSLRDLGLVPADKIRVVDEKPAGSSTDRALEERVTISRPR